MPHYPQPFFRPKKKRWYVQLEGKQINLGPDEADAFRRYHEIMAGRGRPAPVAPVSVAEDISVVEVLDAYLDWCQRNKAPRTYDWYLRFLQSFADALPAGIAARDLKPFHVQAWLDSKPGWATGKKGAVVAVQRALNWGVKSGYVGTNPVKDMERPQASRRESFLTPEQFATLRAAVKDEAFGDVLDVAWDTGCRPNELIVVEAAHVELDAGRWVLPAAKSKGKKKSRVVYLTDAALEITKRLMAASPTGPIFLNTDGVPWSRFSLSCRFSRLKKKTGIACSMYALRHSWATRMLAGGEVDAVTCAHLLGHANMDMLHRHYAHLIQVPDHLRNAARKAGGGGA